MYGSLNYAILPTFEYIENVYVLSETLDGYVFKLSGDISKNEMIQLANSLTLVNEGDLY